MSWRGRIGWILAAMAFMAPASSRADTLYAATVRTSAGANEGISGSLYTVNLGSGSATFIAPLLVKFIGSGSTT